MELTVMLKYLQINKMRAKKRNSKRESKTKMNKRNKMKIELSIRMQRNLIYQPFNEKKNLPPHKNNLKKSKRRNKTLI